MSRSPRSVPSRARRKKVIKQAKGMRGRRKNNITTANAAVDKSLQHNYIGRKERKRNFRALWIQRINAACREHGVTYSRFICGLAGAGIEIVFLVLLPGGVNALYQTPSGPVGAPPPPTLPVFGLSRGRTENRCPLFLAALLG